MLIDFVSSRKRLAHIFAFAAVCCVFATWSRVTAAELPEKVESVLAANCFKCHNASKQSGKLDLRSLGSMLKGGKRGAAIAISSADESRLIQLVQPGAKPHMPPGKKQLSDEDIAVLADWIDSLTPPGEPATENGEPSSQSDDENGLDSFLAPVDADPKTIIDMYVGAGHAKRKITPNGLCDDQAFVRRLYLDLVGRIPTRIEATTFLRQTESTKRIQLIDQLIASDEFPQHFATAFDTLLLGRNEKKRKQRIENGWHTYLTNVFRQDRDWHDVAREVLLARIRPGTDDHQKRGHLWFLYEQDNKHQDIAESISRGFFGVDIQCAQCHDHPMADEIKQAHYWGLVAFFKRSKNENAKHGFAIGESAIGGFDSYANALSGSTDNAVLTFLNAATVAEDRPEKPDKQEDNDTFYVSVENEPRVPKFSRRARFVEEVVSDHPAIARAFVNRMWALLVGQGIVHPIDAMDSQHTPSHPELLDWLARDFKSNGYRPQRLIRAIVRSQAYQCDSRRPESNPEPASFAYGLQKPLSAEAMARSITTAFTFEAGEGIDVKPIERELRELFPDVVAENGQTTLKQTLMLSNLPAMQSIVNAAAEQMMADSADSVDGADGPIDEAFQRTYCRLPTDDEREHINKYFSERKDRPREAMSQILWALVTSAEFRFNH